MKILVRANWFNFAYLNYQKNAFYWPTLVRFMALTNDLNLDTDILEQ